MKGIKGKSPTGRLVDVDYEPSMQNIPMPECVFSRLIPHIIDGIVVAVSEGRIKLNKKCYMSTFIDDITITCSRERDFDQHGWPVHECPEFPCEKIKEINEKEKVRQEKWKAVEVIALVINEFTGFERMKP